MLHVVVYLNSLVGNMPIKESTKRIYLYYFLFSLVLAYFFNLLYITTLFFGLIISPLMFISINSSEYPSIIDFVAQQGGILGGLAMIIGASIVILIPSVFSYNLMKIFQRKLGTTLDKKHLLIISLLGSMLSLIILNLQNKSWPTP